MSFTLKAAIPMSRPGMEMVTRLWRIALGTVSEIDQSVRLPLTLSAKMWCLCAIIFLLFKMVVFVHIVRIIHDKNI